MTFNRFAGLRTLHAHGTLAEGSFFARVPTFSGPWPTAKVTSKRALGSGRRSDGQDGGTDAGSLTIYLDAVSNQMAGRKVELVVEDIQAQPADRKLDRRQFE